jgi:hypothetical protein
MSEVAYLDPFALANGHMSEVIYYDPSAPTDGPSLADGAALGVPWRGDSTAHEAEKRP